MSLSVPEGFKRSEVQFLFNLVLHLSTTENPFSKALKLSDFGLKITSVVLRGQKFCICDILAGKFSHTVLIRKIIMKIAKDSSIVGISTQTCCQ